MEVKVDSYLADKERHYERLEATRLAFLIHVNACIASCIYFEGEIDSVQRKNEAMRISLDAWESPENIMRFSELRMPLFKMADYDLAIQWRDYLYGPMCCMETHGQTALFMCEGHVLEVVSFGRPWEDMVPVTPDIVLTTLLPYDEIITFDGLLMHHNAQGEGPGLKRIQDEFESGLERGIVKDAKGFAVCARFINELRERVGLDPTSYYVLCSYVQEINARTYDTCFPYEMAAHMRSWDEA